jgi:hypothetical protein
MIEDIFHYTEIDTLALILENKTIRFNRLDRVDDISEGKGFKKLKLEQFFFVSCWTYDQEESIPQWHMYTDKMSGVRLKLPVKLFDVRKIEVPESYKPLMHGEIYSPIPFEKIFTNTHFILTNFMVSEHFERVVEYNKDFIKLKNDAINISNIGDSFNAQIHDPSRIASLKSPDWAFQKEFRFVLMILPSFPNTGISDKLWQEKIPNFIANALYNGKGSELEYFDIDINHQVLDSIEITLGPCCSPGKKIIVESLLKKYSKNGVLKESKHMGQIRNKM